jgi:hypothetical protein
MLRTCLLAITAVFLSLTILACGDSGDGTGVDMQDHHRPDGGMTMNGGDMGGPAPDGTGMTCSNNPSNYVELINACTDSQSVNITPFYPTKAPGGVLPPVPGNT